MPALRSSSSSRTNRYSLRSTTAAASSASSSAPSSLSSSSSTHPPTRKRVKFNVDSPIPSKPMKKSKREKKDLPTVYKSRFAGVDDPEDIKALFAHLDYSGEEMTAFVDYMRSPYDIHPVPSQARIKKSYQQEFCFGFYMRPSDIIEWCKARDPNHYSHPDGKVTLAERNFFVDSLSLFMLRRDVRLREAIVTPQLKRRIAEVEEETGETAFVVDVLTTDDLPDGYVPTNREVRELGFMLQKQPYWWEPREDY